MVFKIEFERENCRGCGACTTCDVVEGGEFNVEDHVAEKQK